MSNVRSNVFVAEARERYAFLLEGGFIGPEETEYTVYYGSGRLGVGAYYDDHDGRVLTLIDGQTDGRTARAGLSCLYVSAGLGPAQDIRQIARSEKALGKVIDSHVRALRQIIPLLEGSQGVPLLKTCHGR